LQESVEARFLKVFSFESPKFLIAIRFNSTNLLFFLLFSLNLLEFEYSSLFDFKVVILDHSILTQEMLFKVVIRYKDWSILRVVLSKYSIITSFLSLYCYYLYFL
jgi:hypothetical protein